MTVSDGALAAPRVDSGARVAVQTISTSGVCPGKKKKSWQIFIKKRPNAAKSVQIALFIAVLSLVQRDLALCLPAPVGLKWNNQAMLSSKTG